jgi:flagellar motor protein MotB
MTARATLRPAAPRIGQAWMITFVDLLALCVAFFVLLHAMSSPKPQQWAGTARALNDRLGAATTSSAGLVSTEDPLDSVHGLLRTRLAATAPVTRLPDRVLITLTAATVFDADGKLTADGQRLAAQIAATLAPIASRIDVTGFPPIGEAARRPMQSWRLSFGHATAFAAALAEAGYGRRLAALASGAGHRDRRIQIAVFEDKGDDSGV